MKASTTMIFGSKPHSVQGLIRTGSVCTVLGSPGFAGNPQSEFAGLNHSCMDTRVPMQESLFGLLPDGISYLTVGHASPEEVVAEDRKLLKLLREHNVKRLVLVGLSWGAKRVSDFYRRYQNGELGKQFLEGIALILISPASAASVLRPGPRLAVKAAQWLHIPHSWGKWLARKWGPLFLINQQALKDLPRTRKWVVDLMRESASRSPWFIRTMRAMATSEGFGEPLGQHCPVVVLLGEKDEVVDSDKAISAVQYSYPGAWIMKPMSGISMHGALIRDAKWYAEYIGGVLEDICRLWGIPAPVPRNT